tara:strand:- start:676 stop:846 length:171 start_codon:yes stop_codon:yes gene_type:complete
MGYYKSKLIEDMSDNPDYYERISDIIALEGWRYDKTGKHKIGAKKAVSSRKRGRKK